MEFLKMTLQYASTLFGLYVHDQRAYRLGALVRNDRYPRESASRNAFTECLCEAFNVYPPDNTHTLFGRDVDLLGIGDLSVVPEMYVLQEALNDVTFAEEGLSAYVHAGVSDGPELLMRALLMARMSFRRGFSGF